MICVAFETEKIWFPSERRYYQNPTTHHLWQRPPFTWKRLDPDLSATVLWLNPPPSPPHPIRKKTMLSLKPKLTLAVGQLATHGTERRRNTEEKTGQDIWAELIAGPYHALMAIVSGGERWSHREKKRGLM